MTTPSTTVTSGRGLESCPPEKHGDIRRIRKEGRR